MQPNVNVNNRQNQQPQMEHMNMQNMGQGMGGQGMGHNGMAMNGMGQPMQKSSKMPWIVLIVVVAVVLVGLAFLFRDKLFGKSSNVYQAVFLTNGQVYFGKLSHAEGDYVQLSDIYYLQVNQALQSGQNGQAQQQQSPQLSLVKLGNELHGPTDTMYINHSQILFYEDLKNDGKVVQAIQSYKANPNAANAANTGAGAGAGAGAGTGAGAGGTGAGSGTGANTNTGAGSNQK